VRYIYLISDIEQILQDKCIFNFIHSEQEEGWQPDKAIITTQTNPFSAQ
jgi:hypothetical protein